jgi:hypothetical protein
MLGAKGFIRQNGVANPSSFATARCIQGILRASRSSAQDVESLPG